MITNEKELLDRIDNGFVYLSVGFGNHHLYFYAETGYTEKGHSEKGYYGYVPNAFDNEYDYFKDQLTAYKLYKILWIKHYVTQITCRNNPLVHT